MHFSELYPQFYGKIESLNIGLDFNKIEFVEPRALVPSLNYGDEKARVLVSKEINTGKRLACLEEYDLFHSIDMNRSNGAKESLLASLMLLQPKLFLKQETDLLLHKFFRNTKQTIGSREKWSFNKTSHKLGILTRVSQFTRVHAHLRSLENRFVQIADELVMNAVFHGPVDDKGTHIFSDRPRIENVAFPEGSKPGEFWFLHDQERAIVGCTDFFGSLDLKSLRKHLSNVYRSSEPNIAGEGVGLGLKMLMEECSEIYFITVPGHLTMVICGFDLDVSIKKMQQTPTHIHFLQGQYEELRS